MRVLGAVALVLVASACTRVKMVQRDGCWVKRTVSFGRVQEQVGPCMRPQPKWADDQFTRLVQECVAQADFRWQVRALDAWSHARPYPAQPAEETLRTCLQESRIGLVSENDTLKRRVSDLQEERNTLRTDLVAERTTVRSDADKEREHLRASNDRIAGFLGDAAKRPPASANVTASANATGEGKATNDSGAELSSGSSSDSGAGGPTLTASAPGDTKQAGTPKRAKPARSGRAPRAVALRKAGGCEVPAPVTTPVTAPAPAPAPTAATPAAPAPTAEARAAQQIHETQP
jgi:hypothetical protein